MENTALAKQIRRCASAVFFGGVLHSSVLAAFQAPFLTARSESMGGVLPAEGGDPSCLFSNPAGLAALAAPEAYLGYTNMFAAAPGAQKTNAGFMAAGFPTRLGNVGLGLGVYNDASFLQERTLSLGFARTLPGQWRVGAAVKHLHHSYGPGGDPLAANDPIFKNGTSRGALTADAGVVVPIGRQLRIGVSVLNVNAPDLGLAVEDRVPREVRAGASLRVLGVTAAGALSFLGGQAGRRTAPGVGVEKELYGGRMALRLGAGDASWTGGMGFRLGRMGFDYAFVFNRDLDGAAGGAHKAGLRLQFGGLR